MLRPGLPFDLFPVADAGIFPWAFGQGERFGCGQRCRAELLDDVCRHTPSHDSFPGGLQFFVRIHKQGANQRGDDLASLAGKTVSGKRIDALGSLTCSNSKVFGMLRPLDNVSAGKTRVAALNIDCAKGAGALTVKIKPGNITLSLADKGTHGDLHAHDGIYSANWSATPGSYTLTFSNGKSDTVNVS